VGRRRYFDLVERRFYSPVPDLEALPDDLFDRESELARGKARRDRRGAGIEEQPPVEEGVAQLGHQLHELGEVAPPRALGHVLARALCEHGVVGERIRAER